jgi:hypothetical protein
MTRITVKSENPGHETSIEIDAPKLWELFTETIPDIQGRLTALETKLTLACAVMFVLMAGGFSIVSVLIRF